MKMMGMKCGQCGSLNVGADLASTWSPAQQRWESAGDLDGRLCHDCGADPCDVEEYELRGQELADAMHARRRAGVDEFIARLREQASECGPVGNLVLPELIRQAAAIQSQLYMLASTLAQQDELVDALALTLPYAESRAADLLDAKLNNEPQYGPGFAEDESCPGADEAASVVEYAGKVLAEHGTESRLLERGQRAGGCGMSGHDIGGWSAELDERVGLNSDEIPIYDENDYIVASCGQMGEDFDGENDDANMKATAARIVACVNGCRGISNEALAGGTFAAARAAITERDALLSALVAMVGVQSKRRHPLGAPDEGIATMAAEAMDKARKALLLAGVKS